MTHSQPVAPSTNTVASRRSLSRRAVHAVVFVVCLMVGGALSAVFWDARSQRPASRPLEIAAADLDLGTVWQQPALPFSLTISNVSDEPVAIASLTASCNWTELTPTSFVVPAGGSVEVSGTIDLPKSLPNQRDAQAPFFVGLQLQTAADPPQRWEWPLRGTVRRVVRLSPPVIQLTGANEVVEGVAPPVVDVEVVPVADVTQLRAECAPGDGRASISGPDEQGRYRLSYVAADDWPRGEIDHNVTLHFSLPDDSESPAVQLPVKGHVVGPVRLSPARVALSSGNVGDESSRRGEVHLLSRDGRRWSVTEIESTPEWLAATILENRGGVRFELKQAPAEVTSALVPLALTSSGNDPQQEHLSVRVNYTPATMMPSLSDKSKPQTKKGSLQ